MLDFKQFLFESEDLGDEYDLPDEEEMQKILNSPVRCDNPPDLRGDRYRFWFRLGKTADFVIKFGGIVAPNAKQGSLNAKAFDLMRKRDTAGLYKLLRYVQFNNNPEIRRQLLSFRQGEDT